MDKVNKCLSMLLEGNVLEINGYYYKIRRGFLLRKRCRTSKYLICNFSLNIVMHLISNTDTIYITDRKFKREAIIK